MAGSHRFPRAAARVLAAASGLALAACTYDFDEPFSNAGVATGGGGHGATGTSSGGAGGTSSSTGGGGGGQGGGSGSEDCTNGADDDGDELVDCEDPDCSGAGWTCVEAPPKDWTGPSTLVAGPGSCPPTYATTLDGGTTIDAQPATCAACACSPASGGTCSLPTIAVFDGTLCQAQELGLSPAMAGDCQVFSTSDPNSGFKSSSPSIQAQGTCTPSGGGVVALPPPTWSDPERLCTAESPGGGCAGASVCAAVGAKAGSCIHQSGDVPCPSSSSYTNRTVVYADWADQRSCGACGCGAPTGASCNASTTVNLFADMGCAIPFVSIAADGACHGVNAPSTTIGYTVDSVGPMGGTCASNGGQPTGGVSGVSPITVCCAP